MNYRNKKLIGRALTIDVKCAATERPSNPLKGLFPRLRRRRSRTYDDGDDDDDQHRMKSL